MKTIEPRTLGVLAPAVGFGFCAGGFRFAGVFFGFCEAAQDTRERITIRVSVMDFMLSNSLQICPYFKLDQNSDRRAYQDFVLEAFFDAPDQLRAMATSGSLSW
jgi:hypothetical protein